MPIDIIMPALSPTMEEGVLAKWHVKIGDKLKSGDIIAEIETDKATMEIEAVDEGVVSEILVAEDTQGVKINTVIARIIGDDEGTAPPKAAAPKIEQPVVATPPAAPAAVPPPIPAAISAKTGERLLASPLARRLAAQSNIDIATIKGSGPNGRIIKIDLMNAKPSAAAAATPATPATPPPATIAGLPYEAGRYDIQKLDGMRRTIARRLTESARDVPHFPLQVDIEIDKLLEARKGINIQAEALGGKVSVNDLIIKATALACKAVPAANATFTDEGILLHHHADIAVAVAIDGGLITPVIRNAETKGLLQISNEIKALAAKAKAKKLMPEEYSGGTFSVSNLGMFGIKSFSSIINQPQGCILSVGAGEPRPIVKNGQVVVANVMTVTLTCDHRVVDGSIGAAWVVAFKGFIEEPMSMML
ncbi:MAG: pyruvate dehydrogenase E2 component (dihydrolipoamide acetyltransferase) [Hyphomonadaceae bacterium]|nr:MAG: pyruvate dehydrogenase E2 component (dihydrolipoamide acetyltransferase) [Hyphomonadaceae bacterium]KAF0185299.1 MAG: pyruvate dehydrogenase E2 component (dihydrolipoamide acetyltransferase) [Hyphomonadaceae bacterium]